MNHKQIIRYSVGFVCSIILTLAAYIVVTGAQMHGAILTTAIVTLAIIQLFVQLFCFLHLGEEARPKWRLFMFLNMASIILLIVFGSIWIMRNLNYHMMTPQEEQQYLQDEQNGGF